MVLVKEGRDPKFVAGERIYSRVNGHEGKIVSLLGYLPLGEPVYMVSLKRRNARGDIVYERSEHEEQQLVKL